MLKSFITALGVSYIVVFIMTTEVNAQEISYDYKKIQLVMLERAKDVVNMASNQQIIDAVVFQNSLNLPIDEILLRDKKWQSENQGALFKKSLQANKTGIILKSMVLKNRAIYSEAFLTDNQGANVSAYPATSDYWQGDESKFVIAFNDGRGQLLITPVDFDESSNTYAAQVAAPVVNDRGETIGVLFVGIRLSYAQVR